MIRVVCWRVYVLYSFTSCGSAVIRNNAMKNKLSFAEKLMFSFYTNIIFHRPRELYNKNRRYYFYFCSSQYFFFWSGLCYRSHRDIFFVYMDHIFFNFFLILYSNLRSNLINHSLSKCILLHLGHFLPKEW